MRAAGVLLLGVILVARPLCAESQAVGAGAITTLTPPVGAVVLSPGHNLQGAVNAHPPGTTFFLKAGIYRMQTIVPKEGQTFLGERGAVLNGARLLNSFVREGPYWVATGQTQRGRRLGNCTPASPRCNYPDDFFIDDVPLHHVSSLSAVAPGTFFFDYDAQKIYFADDPTGRKVEASVNAYAFYGSASRVTIRGLTIEKYATPAQFGAIHAKAEPAPQSRFWVVDGNDIRLNHGSGIRLGDFMKVTNNRILLNGQLGIGGSGESILIENNEIAYNNNLGYDHGWEAGGTKFVRTEYLVVRNNHVHNNLGPGLWTDGQNYNTLYETNRVAGNTIGIFHEISYDAVIRHNVVENNGLDLPETHSTFWHTGGILVSASSNVEVYGNTLINNRAGIGGAQAKRGSGSRGPYETRNLYVHDNHITQHSGIAAGLIERDHGAVVFTHWNNRFENNTYYVRSADGPLHQWMGKSVSRTDWQAFGHDSRARWVVPERVSPRNAHR